MPHESGGAPTHSGPVTSPDAFVAALTAPMPGDTPFEHAVGRLRLLSAALAAVQVRDLDGVERWELLRQALTTAGDVMGIGEGDQLPPTLKLADGSALRQAVAGSLDAIRRDLRTAALKDASQSARWRLAVGHAAVLLEQEAQRWITGA